MSTCDNVIVGFGENSDFFDEREEESFDTN
jgi:hypothetical protein